jgi:hypothetical protein
MRKLAREPSILALVQLVTLITSRPLNYEDNENVRVFSKKRSISQRLVSACLLTTTSGRAILFHL